MGAAGTSAIVVGGGPAGLMAAEQLALAGVSVDVFDAMPSVGRKFLRAGVGGLNLTHSEKESAFRQRYACGGGDVGAWLDSFGPQALIHWCGELGIDTFVGSSGRVFPAQKKAAPLLRRWLLRLRQQGVRIHTRHRWLGWNENGELLFSSPQGEFSRRAAACVFATGGGSWSKLGSDGRWMSHFTQAGILCQAFRPSNCGFEYPWPVEFVREHSGRPLKNIALSVAGNTADNARWYRRGDAMITDYGIEGGLVYAASRLIRDAIAQRGYATVHWDLFPERSGAALRAALGAGKRKDSLSNRLRKQWRFEGTKLALLKALSSREEMADVERLPDLVKALPQRLGSARPIDEAISTAGGVSLDALDGELMLRGRPGVFCAGEMLDWDAPTGGYLLTACLASGLVAGRGAARYLGG